MRQDQVLEHQEGQLDPIINVESKPAGDLCRGTTSNLGMVTSMAFSDVMEQDAKNEDLDLVHLSRELGQQRQVFTRIPCPQRLELLYGSQGVLVHGVDMVEIMLYHAQDPTEFGDKLVQHSTSVHLHQSLIDPFRPP